jgi:hypothetical protein
MQFQNIFKKGSERYSDSGEVEQKKQSTLLHARRHISNTLGGNIRAAA